MFDKNVLHLLTILEAVEKINIYTIDLHNADIFYEINDQLNFNASINLLIAIGESSKKIDEDLRTNYKVVNWNEVIGLRNILSHNYIGIDYAIIWDVIQNYLPKVKESCIEMIYHLINTKQLKNNLVKVLENKYYSHLRYLIDLINNKEI
ncbi:MAG: DUF86 domain-containing protein [Ignavibacteriae bacterium]|nr:DUF86 domain-containing protein [Ignavibacteriota bacterium]